MKNDVRPTIRSLVAIRPVSRALFLAVTLIAVCSIYGLLASPVRQLLEDQNAEAAQLASKLARLEALAGRQKEAERLIGDLDAEHRIEAFLPGSTEGAASAGLQAKLKHLAEQAGGRVRSIAGLDRRETERMRFIGAQIAITGRITAIHAALAAIEGSVPYLFVTALSIRASPASRQDFPTQETDLDVRFDVFGAAHVPIAAP